MMPLNPFCNSNLPTIYEMWSRQEVLVATVISRSHARERRLEIREKKFKELAYKFGANTLRNPDIDPPRVGSRIQAFSLPPVKRHSHSWWSPPRKH